MLRDKWEFQFTSRQLIDACKKRIKRHKDRRTFWKARQNKIMEEIKKRGLTVVESEGGSTYGSKFGLGPQIAVDVTFQQKLQETSAKIKEHHAKLGQYEMWLEVLTGSPNKTYQLHTEDYMFFFGIN